MSEHKKRKAEKLPMAEGRFFLFGSALWGQDSPTMLIHGETLTELQADILTKVREITHLLPQKGPQPDLSRALAACIKANLLGATRQEIQAALENLNERIWVSLFSHNEDKHIMECGCDHDPEEEEEGAYHPHGPDCTLKAGSLNEEYNKDWIKKLTARQAEQKTPQFPHVCMFSGHNPFDEEVASLTPDTPITVAGSKGHIVCKSTLTNYEPVFIVRFENGTMDAVPLYKIDKV